MRLTVLADNKAAKGLLPEHGLSFLIEAHERRILFDTGKGEALPVNAAHLDVDLSALDAVVLSHGHYDHTGGLRHVLEKNSTVPIFCHPDVFTTRFSIRDGEPRPISMPPSVQEGLRALPQNRLRTIYGPVPLFRGIHLTGPIPRLTSFEDTGGPFFLDTAGQTPDPLIDDGALFIETDRGIVAVLGCAHSGVINTLRFILAVTGDRPLIAVIGGFHLLEASSERMQQTLEALQEIAPEQLIPCHCTGPRQIAEILKRFPEAARTRAGDVWEW